MTVAASGAYSGPYTPNGVTTAFPFTFAAASADDVDVQIDGSSVPTGLYAVSLNANQLSNPGGTATFTAAPSGTELLILSEPDFAQEINFENAGSFLPETHTEGLDRAAIRDLYLKERVDLLTPGNFLSEDTRAGKFMAWDAAGNPVTSSGTGADDGLRTDLAAASGSSLVKFQSPHLVGAAPAYLRTLGEKAGEVISLIDLAGIPGDLDYTSWFETKVGDYPFKTIQLPPGAVRLAGAGVTGVSNITLRGSGDSQTTLLCPSTTLDLFEVNDGYFWRIENLSVQHVAGATAGRGLVFSGVSGSNRLRHIYATNNPDGFVHFIADSGGPGDAQSGNRISDIVCVDNGGKQIYFKWSNDWGISNVEAGRVTGAFGYADAGFYIEESHQGSLSGFSCAWDNINALYMKGCQGNRIDAAVRLEEAQQENVVLDDCEHCSIFAQSHTPSKSAGLAGTYSAVRLKNATQDCVISIPNIYSWDAAATLMKHGVEIDSGCFDNLVADGIYRNYTVSQVGGDGASDGTNYISNMLPRATADFETEAVFALAAEAGATRFLTPLGKQSAAGVAGVVPGVATRIRRVDVASNATPGAGETYTYQLVINGVGVGSTVVISNGGFSASIGGLNIAVAALDLVEISVVTTGAAAVTNHRATVTFG